MIRDNYLDICRLIKNPKILKLFDVAAKHGGAIRLVGGAVRDALKGIDGSDLDFATDLSPDEMVEACAEEGINTFGVGIKYGTVGVQIDNAKIEVTSLRRDVKTDGRHAEVEFTDNWEEDASRRDLTINAVYADEHGNVFDYYNGIEDLEKGRVRFIGSANQRIREDYLRILRFFRFYSTFGVGEPDKKALAACVENRDGLKKLAQERIRDELFKLLLTPNAAETLRIMQDNNILSYILPNAKDLGDLSFLKKLVNHRPLPDKELIYLFVLYQPDVALADNLAMRLRFSRKEKQKFVRWAEIQVTLSELLDNTRRRRLAYEYGKEFCLEKLLLLVAINQEPLPGFWDIYTEIQNTEVPVFPLSGKDFIEQGVVPEQVGEILKERKQAWLNSNFSLSRQELLQTPCNKACGI